jgi:hypothetical protein
MTGPTTFTPNLLRTESTVTTETAEPEGPEWEDCRACDGRGETEDGTCESCHGFARVPVAAKATYAVELTADQIFGFSDLVRRLARAYGPDQENPLRHDLATTLEAFADLLPEPSEDDDDAYLAAVDAGTLPNWGSDPLPLTQPVAQYEAALLAAVTKAAT